MKNKVKILNVLNNGFDKRMIFLDLLISKNGKNKKSEKITFVMSKKTARFFLEFICCGLEEKKFINKKIMKGGKK